MPATTTAGRIHARPVTTDPATAPEYPLGGPRPAPGPRFRRAARPRSLVKGAEPLWTFRMAGAHFMLAEIGMAEITCRVHREIICKKLRYG